MIKRFSQFFWQATSPFSIHVSTHSYTKGKQGKWGVSLYCEKCSPTHVYTFQIQNVLNDPFGMCKFRNGSVCSAAVQQRMGAVHGWLYRLYCTGGCGGCGGCTVCSVCTNHPTSAWHFTCHRTFASMIGHYTILAKRSPILSLIELWAKHVVRTLPCCSWPWTDYFMVSWYFWQECQGGYWEDGSSLIIQATWVECCFL